MLYSLSGDGFLADVALVDDQRYEDSTHAAIDLIHPAYRHPLLVLADSTVVTSAELPRVPPRRGLTMYQRNGAAPERRIRNGR
ncbi:DUF6924 domain-containing protein [Streptomyces rishiriensis]|uniref:DUF6924 domain-containing protein n=1 Tax=Streptomyces rishiriensis TaxID=68264 RepID=UPI0037BD4073